MHPWINEEKESIPQTSNEIFVGWNKKKDLQRVIVVSILMQYWLRKEGKMRKMGSEYVDLCNKVSQELSRNR